MVGCHHFALPEDIVDIDMVSRYSRGVSVSSDVQHAGYVTHHQRSLKSNRNWFSSISEISSSGTKAKSGGSLYGNDVQTYMYPFYSHKPSTWDMDKIT